MRTTYSTHIWNAMRVKKRLGPYVGIELEYEGADTDILWGNSPPVAPSWTWEKDHSLRSGGIEFISKPLAAIKVMPALDEIKNIMKTVHVKTTKRCAVHVHVNVSDLTMMEMFQFAVYYTLLEPFIFKTYADTREDSHFCVPTWANTNLQQMMYNDATKLYRGIISPSRKSVDTQGAVAVPAGNVEAVGGLQFLAHGGNKHKIPLQMLGNAKYSAMNFTSLETFGTLEFRQHPGTISMVKVKDWVDFLTNLRAEAIKYTSASAVVKEFEKNGFTRLCENAGLYQSPYTSPEYIEDAVDAAIIMVGHRPTKHTNLEWELK